MDLLANARQEAITWVERLNHLAEQWDPFDVPGLIDDLGGVTIVAGAKGDRPLADTCRCTASFLRGFLGQVDSPSAEQRARMQRMAGSIAEAAQARELTPRSACATRGHETKAPRSHFRCPSGARRGT